MSASRIVSRLLSRSFNGKPISNPLKSSSPATSFPSVKRISASPRLQVEVEVRCLVPLSMMPLHSAIATARLTSSLSLESHCWGLVPQGISMPL